MDLLHVLVVVGDECLGTFSQKLGEVERVGFYSGSDGIQVLFDGNSIFTYGGNRGNGGGSDRTQSLFKRSQTGLEIL